MSDNKEQQLPGHVVRQLIEEEKLRFQVRDELERQRKGASASATSLWAFLNSAFGIFLLSSVFVTGVGGLFTIWNQHTKDKEDRIRQEKKLLAEFDFRLKELETRITEIKNAANADDKGALTVYIW